ncbi:unnamed protein product [Rotaria sp. Silwood1]|nr:unnamed protein product [Rotaria sp. Silwood1]CAF3655297.1 unnamed protein product [Rotaria sp. Silwood1]CAF3747680.1 unnamed protein product [Rotaria sp. Silwood1]CAF4619802.1 unnamed protein product [Rotaria sp. Silwood1]CAF4798974.1 unnamed protein product [Rotaria sp. Silwood1]
MTEHIDTERLHEDIHYRFDYFSKFISFTTEDISALNMFASSAMSVIPVIVDSVYRKLFQYDVTKNYFLVHNDVFDGSSKKNENLSLDSAQMVYRRDMLSGYLKRLLLQREWTNEFLVYLSRVARMHTNKTGSTSIHVDFIHINATLTYIENLFVESVWSNENFDNNTKKNVLIALNKVFRIQSDLFLMHYLASLQDNSSTQATNREKDKCICS